MTKGLLLFKRLVKGLRYTAVILAALPCAPKRKLLRRMIVFTRQLPQQFEQPLPVMMAQLTPSRCEQGEQKGGLTADTIRQLADAVAAWHLSSPLGICLRRSLLRYHFLNEAHVPVVIVFGAQLKHDSEGSDIGGHAWLTLNDTPYYEHPKDYQGFVPMYVYPVDGSQMSVVRCQ